MPRVVSFIVLVAILLLVGAVFFQVMAHFVVPLFLASVLVVVFKPLHERVTEALPGYPRLSALATTLLILTSVLLPTVWLGWKAAIECRDVYRMLSAPPVESVADDAVPPAPPIRDRFEDFPLDDDADVDPKLLAQIAGRLPPTLNSWHQTITGDELDERALARYLSGARGLVGAVAVSGVQAGFKLLFGLAIMVLALYYFLADGPYMLDSLMKLSPIDDEYERELLDKFANVSRAVVVASLASAAVQGLLAGIGYYFALNSDAPIFLLTMLTMVLAIVPFAGAAAVWVPTAIWIYLYQVREVDGVVVTGDSFSAIALAIYGLTIVSTIDNVIKPLVLHGQSNLHPLVALISILGGVQTLGPIGILVGPMLVAFAQALLNMVNKELARMGDEQPSAPIPTLTSHLIPDAASAAGDATDAPGSSPSVESTQVAGAPSPPPSAGRRGKGRRRK